MRRAAVQHGLRKLRDIVGGGEQAGIAGHSAHLARRGIVHDAAQDLAGVLVALRGSDARQPRSAAD